MCVFIPMTLSNLNPVSINRTKTRKIDLKPREMIDDSDGESIPGVDAVRSMRG